MQLCAPTPVPPDKLFFTCAQLKIACLLSGSPTPIPRSPLTSASYGTQASIARQDPAPCTGIIDRSSPISPRASWRFQLCAAIRKQIHADRLTFHYTKEHYYERAGP